MKLLLTIIAAVAGIAGPALAQEATGDVAAGGKAFAQCQTCHVVKDGSGEVLAGRNAKTGPNLYDVAGRTAGTLRDFRYGKSMKEAGEKELVWTEEQFAAYVQDPTGYLRDFLGDAKARGKMAYKVRDEKTARDLFAFLKSLGPAS